jgi:hypothetical protein
MRQNALRKATFTINLPKSTSRNPYGRVRIRS